MSISRSLSCRIEGGVSVVSVCGGGVLNREWCNRASRGQGKKTEQGVKEGKHATFSSNFVKAIPKKAPPVAMFTYLNCNSFKGIIHASSDHVIRGNNFIVSHENVKEVHVQNCAIKAENIV